MTKALGPRAASTGTSGLFRSAADADILTSVDELPVAELLPGLYREVLDAVALLEQTGHRREAGRVRSEATAAYSRAWSEGAARRLRRLRDDALRLAGDKHPMSAMRRWTAAKGRSVEGRPV